MSEEVTPSRSGGDQSRIPRRSLLGSLAVMGLAGCPGQGSESNSGPDGSGDDSSGAETGGDDGGWPSTDDPYYSQLVSELSEMGLPGGEFVYGTAEAAAMDAFTLSADVATASAVEVDADQPFSSAVQVDVTESTDDPWSVTMLGTVSDRPVSEGDVLLGVVYLRGSDSSENTPTVQFVAKDDDNLSTNMVEMTPEVQPPAEWTRYYVPMEFDYDAEADTWRWELFLGYGPQTVDIGGIALVDFDQRVPVDQVPSGVLEDGGTESTDAAGDWEAAAEERIQQHRTSDLTVEVTNSAGDPVEGADVSVAMQEHEFGFGTAISAGHLVDETSEGDPYREHVSDLFNLAVLGNHHKWRFWEESRDTADAATEWILDQGLDLRGHVCLWANVSAWAVPPDVVSAMGREWDANGVEDPELDPEYVRNRTHEHIQDILEYYGDDITEWEVVNEVIHKPGFVKAVNGVKATEDTTLEDPDPVEAPVLREWFQTARDAAPEGMPLGFNDYNTLTGPYESTRSQYERQIEYVSGGDAGLDFVGVQCHFNQNSALSPQQVMAGLDRYAQHDVRLRITEFDMSDEGWPEEDKAEFFRKFLKTAFSHPAVDDFLVWGIIDTLHWRDDAPFFAKDWEEKPALEEYRTLVFDEWWTEESGTTDDAGTLGTTGFKGTYEVTASIDGETVSKTVTLGDESTTVELSPE